MGKKIDINKAKCTKLSFEAVVNFAKKDDGDTINGFELEGYTGAVVERWWGNLVVSVAGISAKQQMPVFKNHNSSEIVGYSTKTTNEGKFMVSGVFSKHTDAAKEVLALAKEGFPWQASIGVTPKLITEIKSGAMLEVNGVEVFGPAEVWLESDVHETSFVPVGADSDTSATVFSNVEEIPDPGNKIKGVVTPKEQTMDRTELESKHADLVAEIISKATEGHGDALSLAKKEGAGVELKRIKSVYAQMFPGHEGLVSAAMFDGKSQPGDVAMAINAANIEAQTKAGEDLSNDAPAAVKEQPDGPLKDKEVDKNAPLEKRAKATWDADKALREEFGEKFDTYLALQEVEEKNGGNK
jgi:hypothetical protein